jgi:hypothetical protein
MLYNSRKKHLWLSILLACLLVSCMHTGTTDINGMWQLTAIQDAGGRTQTVDTIYYSFQGDKLFTYTLLNAGLIQSDPTLVLYGYVYFLDQNRLQIQMDKSGGDFFSFLLWRSESVTYTIRKRTSREMILEEGETVYHFVKF